MDIKWEDMTNNLSGWMYRAPVPGGWLVRCTEDALYKNPDHHNHLQGGYEWRTSITFVPDPSHEWRL